MITNTFYFNHFRLTKFSTVYSGSLIYSFMISGGQREGVGQQIFTSDSKP